MGGLLLCALGLGLLAHLSHLLLLGLLIGCCSGLSLLIGLGGCVSGVSCMGRTGLLHSSSQKLCLSLLQQQLLLRRQ